MLIDLAEHQNNGFIALKDIAARQGISKKYLEQIVPVLNRSDILQTNRVGQLLRLTEGILAPVACLEHEPLECERKYDCATLPLWQGLYKVINEYLDGITLQDLLDQQKEHYANDYSI